MVQNPSALKIVAQIVETVEVEAVGINGHCAVFKLYIITGPCQLVKSVVVEHLTIEHEGVTLIHPHMTKGIEGVGGLIVEGTVAKQKHTIVAELHMTYKNLGGTVQALVKVQTIGME